MRPSMRTAPVDAAGRGEHTPRPVEFGFGGLPAPRAPTPPASGGCTAWRRSRGRGRARSRRAAAAASSMSGVTPATGGGRPAAREAQARRLAAASRPSGPAAGSSARSRSSAKSSVPKTSRRTPVGRGQRLGAEDAARAFDQRQHLDARAGARAAAATVSGASALGSITPYGAGRCQQRQVVVEPGRALVVDAHHQPRAQRRIGRRQIARHGSARARLVVGGDRVLQVQHHRIGARWPAPCRNARRRLPGTNR